MAPLTTALFTATLALLGKVAFDLMRIYRERRTMTASLAGEIGAYVILLDPLRVVTTLRTMASNDYDLRQTQLQLFGPAPTGHPVFDKIAGQIGAASADVAFEISKFYNVVSGLRLLLESFSTERFLALPDDIQKTALLSVAQNLEEQVQPAKQLQNSLIKISEQTFWQFFGTMITEFKF